MERVSGDRYVISLKYNNNLCLTAMNGAMPKAGKVSFLDDAGNVCWSIRSGGIEQMWTAEEAGGSSGGGESENIVKQYLVPPYPISAETADYDRDCEMVAASQDAGGAIICPKYPYSIHYGIDIVGRNSSTDNTKLFNIKASGYGKVVSIGEGYYLGNKILIKYPNAAYGTGSSKRDIYFLYCHLETVSVIEGQAITPDTFIGVAGQTGKGAEVNHLHLEAFTQEVFQSPSEGGTSIYCVDPINYLFNSNEDSDIGLRTIVPDSAAPFYRSDSCSGGVTINGFTCTHTNALCFYNTDKINGRGKYIEAVFG